MAFLAARRGIVHYSKTLEGVDDVVKGASTSNFGAVVVVVVVSVFACLLRNCLV